jgi:hypothetical protein
VSFTQARNLERGWAAGPVSLYRGVGSRLKVRRGSAIVGFRPGISRAYADHHCFGGKSTALSNYRREKGGCTSALRIRNGCALCCPDRLHDSDVTCGPLSRCEARYHAGHANMGAEMASTKFKGCQGTRCSIWGRVLGLSIIGSCRSHESSTPAPFSFT